jgi:hypothetical protein
MTETRSGSGTIIDLKVYDEAMGTWLFSGRHRKFDQSRQSLSVVRECHKKSLLPDIFARCPVGRSEDGAALFSKSEPDDGLNPIHAGFA